MLKSHMDAVENSLIAISKIPANSGHSLHKGTPREAFIRTFLENHLPENVSIGTGEIIDSASQPNQKRNQFDIVVYKSNYPKLDFGGGISGFLAESVIATIEVKSLLTSDELEVAILAARNAKNLKKNVVTSFSTGYIPPSILSYVIAYEGPASMRTVHGWLPAIHSRNGIVIPNLSPDQNKRIEVPSPTIDGVFLLTKGFLYFDNVPMGFGSDAQRQQNPAMKWILADSATGNLLLFFLFLQQATANISGQWLNPGPYLSKFGVPNTMFAS